MGATLWMIAIVLWTLTLGLGAVDGIYYHLWKLHLFSRRQARTEHLAHTLRAALLAGMLFVAFASGATSRSRLYWIGALILADWIVAVADVLLERNSRRDIGGLPHSEYFIHVAATAFHSAAEAVTMIALVLAPGSLREQQGSSTLLAVLLPGLVTVGILVGLVHVILLHPRFVRAERRSA